MAGANCAYGIPLHIETPSQVAALEDAIITMQAQRVIFMQMVEETEGGYADPNLSSEIDRLGLLIKSRRESEKGRVYSARGGKPVQGQLHDGGLVRQAGLGAGRAEIPGGERR